MKEEPGMTLIEQAIDFASSVCLDDIPQQVMDTGKWALIDCLGGILAGQSESVLPPPWPEGFEQTSAP